MATTGDASLRNFDDLMRAALNHGPDQRLLMVMIRVDRVHHRQGDGTTVAAENEGTLTPIMVRDRLLEAGLRFGDIVADADAVRQDWEFVMMALLPGRDGEPPASAEAEPHLERMAKALLIGEGIDGFAFFDRTGQPLEIGAPHA